MYLSALMLGKIKLKAISAVDQLNHFLFANDFRQQLGFFRFILCGTLFYMACYRQLNIDQLGEGSMIPRASALEIFPDFYRPLIQWFFWPDAFVAYVHILLIILLFLATIGLTLRPVLLITWILHQGILNRNYSILFGADVIGGLFLFYLSFTKCADYFSLKSHFFKRQKKYVSDLPSKDKVSISSLFVRLMQIQICTIYMYTGFEKLKGNTWWDGTALWTVFANPQFSQFDLKFLSQVPLFFAVGTFLSLIFEIYFPAMMLNNKYRKYWLFAGFFFHVGIGLLLGLMTFSLVMLSTYVLFLQGDSLEKAFEYLKMKLFYFKSH